MAKRRQSETTIIIPGNDGKPLITVTLHRFAPPHLIDQYLAQAGMVIKQAQATIEGTDWKILLDKTVGKLGLKRETVALLGTEEIFYIGDLVQKTEEELWKIQGMEQIYLDEIKTALAKVKLTLDMLISDWMRPSKAASVDDL